MRSRFLATTAVVLISVVFAFFGTAEAQTVYRAYLPPRPVISTWRTVSPTVQVVPTPMIFESPVVVSESAPMRLSLPMSQTVLHYDRPGMTTISTGSSTRVTAPAPLPTETVVSEKIVVLPRTEVRTETLEKPRPLLSVGENLKPLLPKRLPTPENESVTAPLAPPVTEPKPVAMTELEKTPEAVSMDPKTEEELPIQELVVTEREPAEEKDNIFKDIMAPRNIAIPTMVAKPPRPLPPTSPPSPNLAETEPTPIRVEALPTVETEQAATPPAIAPERKPPVPPTRSLVLGQVNSRGLVDETLSEPPAYPEGPVDPGEIDHKLLESATVPAPLDVIDKNFPDKPDKGKPGIRNPQSAGKDDQWVSGALLLTTIIALMVACYAVVLAFEFRQRWLQSVTEQNNRFAMGYDGDMLPDVGYYDELPNYGGGSLYGNTSDRMGLGRFNSDMLEPSVRY